MFLQKHSPDRQRVNNRLLIVVGAALLAAGCGGGDAPKTPLARIGNRTLTAEEVKASLRSDVEPSHAQTRQYLQRWIADELVYREAVNQGLDQSEAITTHLEDVRRRLAINALLEKEVFSLTAAEISADSIRAYYEAHKSEFVLKQDVALVSFVLFGNRDAATSFRNSVMKGGAWDSSIVASGSAVQAHVDSAYHTQQSLRPAELWRVASGLTGSDPSFPINTSDGYYVLRVWNTLKQGQAADLVSVEGDIRHRLTVEQRRTRYEAFIESLRSRQPIEVYLQSVPDDSLSGKQSD
jgi:hypothetical protein